MVNSTSFRRKPAQVFRQALASVALAGAVAGTSVANADGLPDFETLVEEQADTVVSIAVVREALQPAAAESPSLQQLPEELRRFFQQDPRQQPPGGSGRGIGSGFIISEDGYVMTNAHVVNGASEVMVTLDDRRQLPATVVGIDESTDIALLKVDASDLPSAQLGDSDDVAVGEWVLAIGSPFGLDHTATQGIVSAVSRNLPSGGYAPFIQTDVAVNPGNSGGPLFNTDGVVIGVNSQIYSNSGGYQGLSFAIPINVARHVAEQLKSTGHASRGWLGVAIQDVDQGLADAFGLDAPTGALISGLSEDGPAAAAGLKTGDIITEFNGSVVHQSGDLPGLVGVIPAGETAAVTLLRDGKERTLDVTIGKFETQTVAMNNSTDTNADRLGVLVGKLTDEMREERGIEQGVRVLEVDPTGPAAKAAILADDVIVSLDGKNVDSPEAFIEQVDGFKAGKRVAVLIQRGEYSRYVAIEIPVSHE